jgi:hypothetical protein
VVLFVYPDRDVLFIGDLGQDRQNNTNKTRHVIRIDNATPIKQDILVKIDKTTSIKQDILVKIDKTTPIKQDTSVRIDK